MNELSEGHNLSFTLLQVSDRQNRFQLPLYQQFLKTTQHKVVVDTNLYVHHQFQQYNCKKNQQPPTPPTEFTS